MKTSLLPIITIALLFSTFYSIAQIQNPKNLEFTWKTDTSNTKIDLSELVMVLPPRSFEVLNNPGFIGINEGLSSYLRNEPVLMISTAKEAKAYPLNVLTFHEIANDSIGGVPIAATYCPLCNSGLIFDRRVKFKGKDYTLEFEVSGLLRHSDMVMMDNETETWWQQLMGDAIVGKMTGSSLRIMPSMILSVEEFFKRYPNGLILSKETGIERSMEHYGSNPYTSYDSIGNMPREKFFNPANVDDRLPSMERIVNIHDGPDFKIYPFSTVAKRGVINDAFKSKNVVLFYEEGTISVLDARDLKDSKSIGTVTVFNANTGNQTLRFFKKKGRIIDEQTNSEWDITGLCLKGELKGSQLEIEPHSNHFAFAWLSFYPETLIYGMEDE